MLGNANTAEKVMSINATDPKRCLELEFSISNILSIVTYTLIL
jgi:hypothetical protein